jgi:hypothetical protein
MVSARMFADFSSVALALATTRSSWSEVAERLTVAVEGIRSSARPDVEGIAGRRREVTEFWNETVRKLTLLSTLAAHPDVSPDQLVEVLAIVLEKRDTGYSINDREQLALFFEQGLPDDWVSHSRIEEPFRDLLLPELSSVFQMQLSASDADVTGRAVLRILRLVRTANSLAAAIPGDSVDELLAMIRTGISNPAAIRSAPELLPEPAVQRTQVKQLVNELLKDENFSALARLTKHLMASVSLPRHLSEPDELQMGGVSDIASRGQLDKLLLSELAHDDLTLSVRLALNEALYLRRESPPSARVSVRCVLIDVSLPVWGIPRLYGLAVALSLCATAEREIQIRCFRGENRRLATLTLTTTDGVAGHMAALSCQASPEAVLEPFFEAVREEAALAEPVIITTSDILLNESFRRKLDAVWQGDVWIITAERNGQLQILRKTRQGTSLYRKVQLPLNEIPDDRLTESIRQTEPGGEQPAILSLSQLPLLLMPSVRAGRVWHWGDWTVSVMDDCRLLLSQRRDQGARELANCLPVSKEDRCFVVDRWDETFAVICCVQDRSSATLIQIRRTHLTLSTTVVEHQLKQVTDVHRTDSGLLMFGINNNGVPACCSVGYPTPGFPSTLPLPSSVVERCGRVVRTEHGVWHVLDVVMAGNSEQDLLSGAFSASWSFQAVPDHLQSMRQLAELTPGEYVGMDDTGRLIDPTDPGRFSGIADCCERHNLVIERFCSVSLEGSQITVQGSGWGRTVVLDVRNDRILSESTSGIVLEDSDTVELHGALERISSNQLKHHFQFIGTDGRRLLLKSDDDVWYQIEFDVVIDGLMMTRMRNVPPALQSYRLTNNSQGVATGYTLQQTRWPGGGKAWLDSRGMLHLKSSDSSLPEITLVLYEGLIAGWTSNASVFGNPCYIGTDNILPGLRLISAADVWLKDLLPLIESLS